MLLDYLLFGISEWNIDVLFERDLAAVLYGRQEVTHLLRVTGQGRVVFYQPGKRKKDGDGCFFSPDTLVFQMPMPFSFLGETQEKL